MVVVHGVGVGVVVGLLVVGAGVVYGGVVDGVVAGVCHYIVGHLLLKLGDTDGTLGQVGESHAWGGPGGRVLRAGDLGCRLGFYLLHRRGGLLLDRCCRGRLLPGTIIVVGRGA